MEARVGGSKGKSHCTFFPHIDMFKNKQINEKATTNLTQTIQKVLWQSEAKKTKTNKEDK